MLAELPVQATKLCAQGRAEISDPLSETGWSGRIMDIIGANWILLTAQGALISLLPVHHFQFLPTPSCRLRSSRRDSVRPAAPGRHTCTTRLVRLATTAIPVRMTVSSPTIQEEHRDLAPSNQIRHRHRLHIDRAATLENRHGWTQGCVELDDKDQVTRRTAPFDRFHLDDGESDRS